MMHLKEAIKNQKELNRGQSKEEEKEARHRQAWQTCRTKSQSEGEEKAAGKKENQKGGKEARQEGGFEKTGEENGRSSPVEVETIETVVFDIGTPPSEAGPDSSPIPF